MTNVKLQFIVLVVLIIFMVIVMYVLFTKKNISKENFESEDNTAGLVDIGSDTKYEVTFATQNVDTIDYGSISVDSDIPMLNINLESVGNNKLICHWEINEIPPNKILHDIDINVYECDIAKSECRPEYSNRKITSFDKPSIKCQYCYFVLDNINMTKYKYLIRTALIYKNQDGTYIKSRTSEIVSKQEVENNLDGLYENILDQIINENLKQTQMNVEQQNQISRVNELRSKITELKKNIALTALNKKTVLDTPYKIKKYYKPSEIYDNLKDVNEVMIIDGVEYKI